jgi:hypothetical protein
MDISIKKEISVIVFAGILGIAFGAGITAGRKTIDYFWPDKEITVKHIHVDEEGEDCEHI